MWKVNDDGQRNMAIVHLNGKLEPQGALIAHLSTMSTSVNKLD